MNSVESNVNETSLSSNITEMDSLDYDQLFKAAADVEEIDRLEIVENSSTIWKTQIVEASSLIWKPRFGWEVDLGFPTQVFTIYVSRSGEGLHDLDLTREILEKRKRLTKETDDNGWTPLHCAAYYGCCRVTQLLLEFDKSAAYMGDKYRKMTPLHLAASQGHIDIMKKIVFYCPDCYELVDDRGWNVLHFAMATLNEKKLSSFLQNRFTEKLVHEKDIKGNTPLHVLATCTRSMKAPQFFKAIINQVRATPFAVNKRNVNAANAYLYGYPELEQEILALSEDIDNAPYARGLLRLRGSHRDEHFEQLKGAKESHLIAAALIATVTFAAAFTLPGGYKNEEGKNQGTAILSRNSAFQAFVITDAIAMVFSLSAVFIYVVMSLEMFKKHVNLFEWGAWITVVAMGAMVIAFVTGTYAVLAPSLWLAIVTCFIGLSYFVFVLSAGYHIKILRIIRANTWLKDIKRLVKRYLMSLILPTCRRQRDSL
ncbi:hypothetical protein EZV62_000763 [Acer yangbiense]|uniref:PGG domain-containing protein n=1 Tax=Acer yangbiense TaxID=1000413 RepID=A0A5C7ITN5_9ROSI|nr:hypothetical protein EZV62_000763 [Acer yangbiense]